MPLIASSAYSQLSNVLDFLEMNDLFIEQKSQKESRFLRTAVKREFIS
jgi:hypothetical protein